MVELSRNGLEQVALREGDAISKLQALGVCACDVEGVGREIGRDGARLVQVGKDGEGDAAAASANVGDKGRPWILGGRVGASCARVLQDFSGNDLGAWSRDEHALVELDGQAKERPLAEEILHGLVLQCAGRECAQGVALRFARGPIGVRVEMHALALEDMLEQKFRRTAGFVNALSLEGVDHPGE